MKIFFDTCAVVDFLCDRQHSKYVEEILNVANQNNWECYISIGSFYTLTYLLELHLKRNGFEDKESRIVRLREILQNVLDVFSVSDIFASDLLDSIRDDSFTDLEDSYQFRAALAAECDYLITINARDFKDADTSHVKVLLPSEFLQLFDC